MATTTKPSTLLWLCVVLVLVVNLAVMCIPVFIKQDVVRNLIKPFTTAIFMMEGIFFLLPDGLWGYDSRLPNTGGAICVLFIVVFAMLENFLPEAPNSSGGNDNKDNNDNGNVDHNVDQQSLPNETSQASQNTGSQQQQQNTSQPSGGKPSLDNMGDFKYLTAIYVVIMWVTYMMDGMSYFAGMKDGPHPAINALFVYIFRLGTLQYVYGMLVMNDNPPKWLYYLYMVPQAVLWPIASLISFYVHKPTGSMDSCAHCFAAILAGAILYMGFRMMYQFQQAFKDDNDTKNRIIQGVTLAVGYLWFCFVGGIWTMNN
ncbi:hypothetical protein M9Y10_029844 [Tritrichomonas musculus]|uniref:Uncharacterized protein n=1 Tax=Tritrichomonas musculus TaxID=1915356 RepID=A0ABR2KN85_9EUKA